MNRLVLLEKDNGKTLNLTLDQEIEIILVEDPSSKMKWLRTPEPYFLKITDEAKKTYTDKSEHRQFTYKAVNTGNGILAFHYRDGWDESAAVVKTVLFPVTVA